MSTLLRPPSGFRRNPSRETSGDGGDNSPRRGAAWRHDLTAGRSCKRQGPLSVPNVTHCSLKLTDPSWGAKNKTRAELAFKLRHQVLDTWESTLSRQVGFLVISGKNAFLFSPIRHLKADTQWAQARAPANRTAVEFGEWFCETAKEPGQKWVILHLGAAIGSYRNHNRTVGL